MSNDNVRSTRAITKLHFCGDLVCTLLQSAAIPRQVSSALYCLLSPVLPPPFFSLTKHVWIAFCVLDVNKKDTNEIGAPCS